MKSIKNTIVERRSVRTYDGKGVPESVIEKLFQYIENIKNPFNIPVAFKILNAKEDGLVCPVVAGTDLYIAGKVKNIENANVAFGYSFEEFILYAHSIGLGTVWLGGTMNRSAYEKAMNLEVDEIMPCASPVGYTAKKMSIRETMMRKAIKADERLTFEEVFFHEKFDVPLTKEKAGKFGQLLEMVRLAPSAVNKQPWRVVVEGDTAHFYLKRTKGYRSESGLDIQMVDMGIALCHFALTAKENGMDIEFKQENPNLDSAIEATYIASYKLM